MKGKYKMEFTYKSYKNMLDKLKNYNYNFCNYKNYSNFEKCVILRHDVDNSLKNAVKFAYLEYKNNVQSTYFILLSTNFYNIFSKESRCMINEIKSMGHEIGLHFDEVKYDISNEEDLKKYAKKEMLIMSIELEMNIDAISMHRPSKWLLEKNIKFDNVVNSYEKIFFEQFKYLSDSRMDWREDVLGIIESQLYNKLHILTHSFWYTEENLDITTRVIEFIKNADKERYYYLKDNIRDLEKIISDKIF